MRFSPAARHLISHLKLDPSKITPTGPRGHILKSDVLEFLSQPQISQSHNIKFDTPYTYYKLECPVDTVLPVLERANKSFMEHIEKTAHDVAIQYDISPDFTFTETTPLHLSWPIMNTSCAIHFNGFKHIPSLTTKTQTFASISITCDGRWIQFPQFLETFQFRLSAGILSSK